jgi:hydroxyacylglutathione hydrolase
MISYSNQLSALPPEALVYCAHEYTLSNLKFLASVDGDAVVQSKFDEVKNMRMLGEPTVPTTIGKMNGYYDSVEFHHSAPNLVIFLR